MSCQRSQQLHAWHDGQLSEHDRAVFGEHLAGCAQCQEDLRQISALSRLFFTVRASAIPPDVLHRLHQSSGMLRGRAIMRFARRLTIAAAMILAIGAVALMRQASTPAQPVAMWERTMVDWREAAPAGAADPEIAREPQELAMWLEAGPFQSGSHE